MENKKNYHDEQNKLNTLRMRNVLSELPAFCKQFFRGIENNTSSKTRLAYAYDLRVFFEYMHKNNCYCNKMEIMDFPISILYVLVHLEFHLLSLYLASSQFL